MHDSKYRVKVLKGGGFSKLGTCRLGISVGQEYHESEKLKATFIWASKRFDHVIVSVADTLQRHNMDGNHGAAKAAGDVWLERNKEAFTVIPGAEIQRWDQWLNHKDYQMTRRMIDRLYDIHAGFKSDISKTAAEFAARKNTRPEDSVEYLLEETAIFALQQQAVEAADVYPGTVMAIWERFRHENIEGAPIGLSQRRFTRIGFVRR